MRTDRIALVAGQQIAVGALVDEHVEVVEPEVGHHFVELPFAVDRAQQLGLRQLLDHHLLGILERHHRFFLLRAHSLQQRVCLGACGRGGERLPVFGRHFQNRFHALVGRQIEKFLRLEICEPAFFARRCIWSGSAGWSLSAETGQAPSLQERVPLPAPLLILAVLLVFVALELRFVNRAPGGIARQRGFPVGDLLDQLFGRKILDDLFRFHAQRAERTSLASSRGRQFYRDGVGVRSTCQRPSA